MSKTKAKEFTKNLLNYQFLDYFANTVALAYYFFHLLFLLNQLILKEIIRWFIEDLSPNSWGDPLCPSSSSQHVRKGISTEAPWVRPCSTIQHESNAFCGQEQPCEISVCESEHSWVLYFFFKQPPA